MVSSLAAKGIVVFVADALSLAIPTLTLAYILVMSTKCSGQKTRIYTIAVIGLLLIIISGACRITLDSLLAMMRPG